MVTETAAVEASLRTPSRAVQSSDREGKIMRRLISLVAVASVCGAGIAVLPASAHRAHTSATPAKLQVRTGKLGRYVVDGKGLTLYLFEKDKQGKSACYTSCAKVWAPLITSGKPTAGSGIVASKIGTTKRKDGKLQATYGGHPLYHYDDDHKAGQTEGQGSTAFGAGWYVVAPSGKKIDKS
jgi:predicted lipoprotein with Yx(FWY)xxD motif